MFSPSNWPCQTNKSPRTFSLAFPVIGCSLSSGDCSIYAFSHFHVPEVRNKDQCGNRKIKIWKLASEFQFSFFVKIENWHQILIFVFLRDWKLKFDVEFQFSFFWKLKIENWSACSFFNFLEKRLALEYTHCSDWFKLFSKCPGLSRCTIIKSRDVSMENKLL